VEVTLTLMLIQWWCRLWVQAVPAAPAAVRDVWFGISVSHTKCMHV
jgi:hypothetical protein